MMNRYNLLLAVVLLLFTFSCNNTSKNSSSYTATTNSDSLKQGLVYVQQIPDSLRTPKQKELVKNLIKMTIQHIKVVDNRIVFDMTREEFLRTDVPMKYYDLFKKNMKVNNRWIKKNNIKDVDKMLKEYRRTAQEKLNNM